MSTQRQSYMRKQCIPDLIRHFEHRHQRTADISDHLIVYPTTGDKVINAWFASLLSELDKKRTRDVKSERLKAPFNRNSGPVRQTYEAHGSFGIGLRRHPGSVKPDVAVIDIDEVEHDQKGVICRQEDRMLSVTGLVEMDDSEPGFAKRPDYQRPCGVNPKTGRNSLTDRHCFTHMCLDYHPDWELCCRTTRMTRSKVPTRLSNVYLEQKDPCQPI